MLYGPIHAKIKNFFGASTGWATSLNEWAATLDFVGSEWNKSPMISKTNYTVYSEQISAMQLSIVTWKETDRKQRTF